LGDRIILGKGKKGSKTIITRKESHFALTSILAKDRKDRKRGGRDHQKKSVRRSRGNGHMRGLKEEVTGLHAACEKEKRFIKKAGRFGGRDGGAGGKTAAAASLRLEKGRQVTRGILCVEWSEVEDGGGGGRSHTGKSPNTWGVLDAKVKRPKERTCSFRN